MKKILIADDEENLRTSLQDILEEFGYDVTSVDNGRDVMEKTAAGTFDLLICDLLMPKMDGASVAHDLGNRINAKKMPIIFVSGLLQREALQKIKTNNEDIFFIAKPYEVKDLIALVKKALKEDNPI